MPLLLIVLLFLPIPNLYSKTITFVTNDNNPPFSFTLPNQSLTGLYVEFWELWAKHNQRDINFYVESFANSINDVRSKNVIHSGVFSSKERQKWAAFSLPIHRVDTGVLLNRKHHKSTQLKQLINAKVAVQVESYQAKILEQEYKNIEAVYFSDPGIVFIQLLNNEIDAIVGEVPFIQAQLSKLGLNGVLELSNEILHSNLTHAMVSNENRDVLKIVNEGIENIPIAEIIELERKWLPTSQPFFDRQNYISFLTYEENQWLKTHQNFSLGIDTAWYPFEFTDEKGRFSGISADYIAYLSKTLGVKLNPEYNRKWTESFELFKQDKIDIMSAVIPTDERKKSINFTQTYFNAPTVIVTNNNSPYVDDMKDLFGKKLSLVKGFAIVELVRKDYPEIEIVLANSIIEGLESLQNNEVDAYLGTLAVINYEIDKQGFDDLKIAAFAPYKFEISMAIRKGLEPLISIFNKAFENMSEKQNASIANDWLAIHISTGTQFSTILKWSLPIIGSLLLIIIIIYRYNKKLQKQIQHRLLAEKELQHLATHDALTGLPNWRSFEKQFEESNNQESHQKQAILFIDLDDFKKVNDKLGHAAGDRVLKDTASRLLLCIKDNGLVVRVGGDEFIIFLHHIENFKHLENTCQSIIDSISRVFVVKQHQNFIGASIGAIVYSNNSNDINTLVQIADSAMYKAKQAGKNRYHIDEQKS